ncbi:MAG: hypothetical protein ACOC8G_00255 [Thermodesulfobacteriota bacterium]
MKTIPALVCLCACLAAAGCGPGRSASAPKATAVQNQQIYQLYRQYMEALNQQRRQADLPPLEIRSYEAFRRHPGTD